MILYKLTFCNNLLVFQNKKLQINYYFKISRGGPTFYATPCIYYTCMAVCVNAHVYVYMHYLPTSPGHNACVNLNYWCSGNAVLPLFPTTSVVLKLGAACSLLPGEPRTITIFHNFIFYS